VKPKHVAQWVDSMADRQLARSTVRNAFGVLSVAMRDAVMAGHLHANPCAGVVLPRTETRTEDEWTFLSATEVAALLGHRVLDASFRRIYTIAIYTGLRQGELWGLRWEDVRLDEARLVVRYGNANGGPTKSGKPRTVPLFAPARAALLELRELGGVRRVGGHVFTWTPKGEPPRPFADGYDGSWAGSWHRRRGGPRDGERVFRDGWRERCGVRSEVRFHDFRHTCASHLIMGTWGRAWRCEEVQVLLGHTSISTTQRYAHLAPEGMDRTIAEAEQMWRELAPQSVTASVTPFRGRQKDE
jgi:integrase